MDLTSNDIIILSVLIGIIVVVGIICIILTVVGGKKKVSNDKEEVSEFTNETKLNAPDIHIALATDNIPDLAEKSPVMEEEPVLEEIDIPVTSYEDDEEELEEVPLMDNYDFDNVEIDNKEELEKEEAVTHTKIEDVLAAMQRDLEKQKYDKIDAYEEEQEENAVISYQELLDRKMALNNDNEPVTPKTDILSKLNVKEEQDEEVEEKDSYLEKIAKYDVEIEPKYEWKDERQFASSEFISPIFGRQDSTTFEYPTVKKTVETEEFSETYLDENDEEVTETTKVQTISEELDDAEFLNTLKEFRKNL